MLERIERGFRSQQQFIRNASHEMRTPLTAITAETDLALLQTRSPQQYQTVLENVRSKAENLNELVNQLLLMTKVEAQDPHSEALVTAADEALLEVLRMLQFKHPAAQTQINLQLEAAEVAMFLVGCDPAILQASYFNLLDNAVKYGLGQPIHARLYTSDRMVCLRVTDQGQGIHADEMPYLFEPFYRCKNHGAVAGSGIGLSLVKSIADKYGGSIQVSSQIGSGTTVQLVLPQKI